MRQQRVHWEPSYNKPRKSSVSRKKAFRRLKIWSKLLISSLILCLLAVYVGIVLSVALL